MSYLAEDIESSLIKDIEYDADTRELRVAFRKYYVNELVYENVPFNFLRNSRVRLESLMESFTSK